MMQCFFLHVCVVLILSWYGLSDMSNGDEEFSAMLEGDHHNLAQMTLASAMALTSSPVLVGMGSSGAGAEQMQGSPFISHYSSSLPGGFSISSSDRGRQLASATRWGTNLSGGGGGGVDASDVLEAAQAVRVTSRSRALLQQQQPLWPSIAEQEKVELDSKNQIMKLAANTSHLNNSRFNPISYATSLGSNPPSRLLSGGGLQRYHSAPSSLLQSLTDCHEDAFSQVSSPLGGNAGGNRDSLRDNHVAASFCSENHNLTSITEGVVQQMETDDKLSNAAHFSHQYNQFLSPPTKSEKRASFVLNPVFGGDPDDRLGNQRQLGRDNLLRQSSLPADWLTVLQDSIDETIDLSSQFPSITSPDESLSGATSEETGAGASGKSSIYSRDDSFLVSDTVSGGLWSSPTSPVSLIGGKRLHGVLGETTVDTAVSGKGSLRGRLGEPGTLIRHSSLPATINRPTSPVFDDLDDISVPYQTRAKRGCATHPRSIAERVRRTKISERMKRLQDLVPNMDKQTNTSDMLDEAVEYVKQLQQQVKELSDTAAQLRELQGQRLTAEGKESL
ncbi:unnamed protein product [Sphagnum troendelagicum]